jgi:hypothetical protein
MHGEMRNAYKILVGKFDGRKSLKRPKCKLGNNIKMNLREKSVRVWSGFNWLRQAVVGTVMNLQYL